MATLTKTTHHQVVAPLDPPATLLLYGAEPPSTWHVDVGGIERYWLPVVGPSCIVVARNTMRLLSMLPSDFAGVSVDADHYARTVGLVPRTLTRALCRLERFGLGWWEQCDGLDTAAFALPCKWPGPSPRTRKLVEELAITAVYA